MVWIWTKLKDFGLIYQWLTFEHPTGTGHAGIGLEKGWDAWSVHMRVASTRNLGCGYAVQHGATHKLGENPDELLVSLPANTNIKPKDIGGYLHGISSSSIFPLKPPFSSGLFSYCWMTPEIESPFWVVIIPQYCIPLNPGWWFQTFFIFHSIWWLMAIWYYNPMYYGW